MTICMITANFFYKFVRDLVIEPSKSIRSLYFGDNVQFPFSIHECIYIHAFLIPNLSTGPNLLPSASSLKDPLEPRYLAQRNVMILTLGIPIADSLACYCAIKPVSPQARNMLTMIASQNGFGKDFEPQQ